MIEITICNFSFDNVQENLALEELILKAVVSGKMQPVVRTWCNPNCVIMGISRSVEEDLIVENILSDDIPIARRVTGGGTVYHDSGTMSYSFFFPWEIIGFKIAPLKIGEESIKKFLEIIISTLERCGIKSYSEGISDIFVNSKKVSGNAQKRAKGGILHHGTILLEVDIECMERYLRIPKERKGILHRDFVTSLTELGFKVSKPEFHKMLATTLSESGFKLRDVDFAREYSDLLVEAKELAKTMYNKREWVYRRR